MDSVRCISPNVLDNYEVLFGVWNDALSLKLDGEMKARIMRVNAQMYTFNFLFGICLGNLLCMARRLSQNFVRSFNSQ